MRIVARRLPTYTLRNSVMRVEVIISHKCIKRASSLHKKFSREEAMLLMGRLKV